MKRGKLISLEGIDGVGKTTCVKYLIEHYLQDQDTTWQYVNRKEIPNTNSYVKKHMEYLYAIMWGKGKVFSQAPNVPFNGFNKEHWRYLFLVWYSAFEQHRIIPLLNKGVSVILDGYFYKEMVKAIESSKTLKTSEEFDFLYKPDLSILLEARPEDCIGPDSNSNPVESGSFGGNPKDFIKTQTHMSKIYEELAEKYHWAKVKRDKSVEVTCQRIMSQINEFI